MPTSTPLILAFAFATLVACIALAWLHLRYWVRRLTLDLPYAHVERLTCDDGAIVEVRRVPRDEAVSSAGLPPILLVHGVAANHRNQDLHPNHSLARHLATIGRDVWLLTLRSGVKQPRGARRSIRLAAMVRHDLPLGVRTVLARTGATSIDYVGFSMGGMLLYGAIDRTVTAPSFRRVVTVGSPTRLRSPLPLPALPRALIPRLPLKIGARAFAFLSEWFATPLHRMIANPRNVADGVTRLALVNVIEDIAASLNADFHACITTGAGDVCIDGSDIVAHLPEVAIPALFVAGADDRLAPASSVKRAFDAWAIAHPTTPKRFLVLGRDAGAKEDYGHGDLAVGAHVGDELFPLIARFLGPDDGRDTPRPEAGKKAVSSIEGRDAL